MLFGVKYTYKLIKKEGVAVPFHAKFQSFISIIKAEEKKESERTIEKERVV